MDLDTVVTELYGVALADFTRARNARAGEAKKSGDRELAAAIAKLRRPSTSVWLANLLVRERKEQVVRLLDLGAALRHAQSRLAMDELKSLQGQRRPAVAGLVDAAVDLACQRGETVSSTVARELETTLEAALLDPQAAGALQAGCLAAGLAYAGLGWSGGADEPVSTTSTAAPEPAVAPEPMAAREERSVTGPVQADPEVRLTAERVLRAAGAHLAAVQEEADRRRSLVVGAEADQGRHRQELARLERELDRVRAEVQSADSRLGKAQEALLLAEQRVRAAEARLGEATAAAEA